MGKGMPRLGQPNSRGDLYARARLVLPEPMSDREVNAFRELAAARGTRCQRERALLVLLVGTSWFPRSAWEPPPSDAPFLSIEIGTPRGAWQHSFPRRAWEPG